MDELRDLLTRAAEAAAVYRSGLASAPAAPDADMGQLRKAFGGPLPEQPSAAAAVVEELIAAAEPGLVSTAGPRFFGFVIGGALPAATAADMLAVGWDQTAFNAVLSPAGAAVEECAAAWLKELLGLPTGASVGFVTGAQEANTVGLAVGRHAVLAASGWDLPRDGLTGAPRIRVVAGVERHATIDRSVRLLGLGTAAIASVAADANGGIDVADLERVLAAGTGPALVCLQAGNVNTGAVDPLRAAIEVARRHDAWVHVDGAFGLWAGASASTRHLVDGVELADSWGCDGHKWLNVPYDSGFVFCARPDLHVTAVSYTASYLTGSGAVYSPSDFTLSSSRRARGFAVWAALRELGRGGVEELIDRTCSHARLFATLLSEGGGEVLNDVVLNQVLVGFGDDARTDAIIDRVQRDGTCWVGGTTWRGRRLMRVSVSSWMTTEDDVRRSAEAILRAARP
ncbi:MAG: amino acid decarboxylase, pyridoxal-dependent protein [Frankiales bacterium]|nr:amino acid decarboxylase, pyridoxal-dependent protein [Frankiales bacterium]